MPSSAIFKVLFIFLSWNSIFGNIYKTFVTSFQDLSSWRQVFLLASLIMVAGNVVSLLFVNYSVQPWNTYWVDREEVESGEKIIPKRWNWTLHNPIFFIDPNKFPINKDEVFLNGILN